MKFELNNRKWEIIELDNEEFKNRHKEIRNNEDCEKDSNFAYGFCDYASHTICLNRYQCENEMKPTLIHELVHCWLWCHGASYQSYCEDALCDTVSALIDFINEIVNKYFK